MTTPHPALIRPPVTLPEPTALDGHDTVVTAMISTVRDVDFTNGVAVLDAMNFPPPVHSPCVDLEAVFGAQFKFRREADGVTWNATPESERIWLLEIPGKYGVVYPTGGDILAATITSRKIGNMVAALPCIRTSRGDVERVVSFHLNDAEAVLELLKPYRRRQISPEEWERLVALGRLHGAVGLARAHQQRRHGHSDLSVPLWEGGTPHLQVKPSGGLRYARSDVRGGASANRWGTGPRCRCEDAGEALTSRGRAWGFSRLQADANPPPSGGGGAPRDSVNTSKPTLESTQQPKPAWDQPPASPASET